MERRGQGYVVEPRTKRVDGVLRVEGGRVIAGGLMVFVCMGTSPRVEVVIAHQGMDRKSERSLNAPGIGASTCEISRDLIASQN